MSNKADQNYLLWETAKSAGTIELVRLLSTLKQRGWTPKIPAEKEWFEELINLCAPCSEDSINESSADLLRDSNSVEVIRILSPFVSAGNYSLHIYKDDQLLTHCPASSGLVEFWEIPTCEQRSQLKLYSRRSAFHLSKDKSILVSYTDRNTVAVDSFPEHRRIREWEHLELKQGNSFRIEVLSDDNEIIATDLTGGIYFLSTTQLPQDQKNDFFSAESMVNIKGMRKYERILPHKQVLLAASKNGRYLLVPSFDQTTADLWLFPDCRKIARVDGSGTSEISFLSAVFSPDSHYLIATGVNELQVRQEPFAQLNFSIPLGLGNNLPVFAISPDSKKIAVLPRSNPAQIQLHALSSGDHLGSLRLPEFFSRFAITELKFTPDCEHLMLAGSEHVYLIKLSGEDFSQERAVIRSHANKRVRDLDAANVVELDSLYRSRWISSQMRPWVDMMMYLHNRRKNIIDIDLEETQSGDLDEVGAFDIELEDAK